MVYWKEMLVCCCVGFKLFLQSVVEYVLKFLILKKNMIKYRKSVDLKEKYLNREFEMDRYEFYNMGMIVCLDWF